jgi:hypothetical protein
MSEVEKLRADNAFLRRITRAASEFLEIEGMLGLVDGIHPREDWRAGLPGDQGTGGVGG